MEIQRPKAIVLPGAERWHRGNVIGFAAECGFVPILAVQKSEEAIIDESVQKSIGAVLTLPAEPNEQDVVNLAGRLSRISKSWFVFPLDDYVSESAAKLSQYCDRPCYPYSAAHEVFHKHLLRKRWNDLCHRNPEMPFSSLEFALYKDDKSTPLIKSGGFANSGGAFIVKPDAYSGSVAVFRAGSRDEIPAAVSKSSGVMDKEGTNPEMRGIAIDRHILAEEEVPRKPGLAGCAEFTAHYLSFGGKHLLLGIAEKMIDATTYVETAHVFPSPSFPANLLPALEKAVETLLDELPVQNTISNWEFIVTPDDKLVLVEGQLRPSGDHVMDLIQNAILFSPYVLFFRALEAGRLSLEKFETVHTSVICWPRPSVMMERISHIEVPVQLPRDTHLHIDREALLKSRNWRGPLSWYDRHVSVVATGMNAPEAWKKCRKVLDGCHLKGVTPDGKHTECPLIFP